MAELPMTLLAFRVTNFRSVRDSGWIETGDVTALIGTNESGKTNLLAPLWKLNPAKEGSIKLITDAPRVDFNTYRVMKKKPVFISGRFRLSEQLVKQVSRKVGASIEELREVEVSRDFDGNLAVNFPKAKQAVRIALDEIEKLVNKARADIEAMTEVDETDAGTKASVMAALETASEAWAEVTDTLGVSELTALKKHFDDVTPEKPSATSTIVPRFKQVGAALEKHIKQLGKPTPNDSAEAKQIITENLPVFVYYSTYGNLDSEINLPRAIEDLQRTDLTGRPEARARTLRVLFDFVNLSPQEILELGLEAPVAAGKKPTDEQNAAFAEKTKERSVLLQSASTLLTRSFREWWKQGEYIIRFEADGNHFRIWVSDDKRHEQIELENRSTGLQWFLSFYLIFLVESKAAHSGAILLLDEPGLSLHPLSQRDLTNFFDNLAITNPILYTTHSPFLVDADHLDRVRAVYVDDDGHTQVSTNLRAGKRRRKRIRFTPFTQHSA